MDIRNEVASLLIILWVETIETIEMTFCSLDRRPEAQVHRAKDDETPSEAKGVEDPFQHGMGRVERAIYFPEPLLEFFHRHPFGLKDNRGHIVL